MCTLHCVYTPLFIYTLVTPVRTQDANFSLKRSPCQFDGFASFPPGGGGQVAASCVPRRYRRLWTRSERSGQLHARIGRSHDSWESRQGGRGTDADGRLQSGCQIGCPLDTFAAFERESGLASSASAGPT